MAANKSSIITEQQKRLIEDKYCKNIRFKKSELARELGIPPMVVINYLHKYLKKDYKEFVNPDLCPITGAAF